MSGGRGRFGAFLALAMLAVGALAVPPGVAAIGSSETATQVIVTGTNITVEVSKTGPALLFFSPGHRDLAFRFRYTRLLTFNDTGDGSYSPDELSYFCNLSGPGWQVSVQTRETAEAGKEITVTLSAVLDMTERTRGSSSGRSVPDGGAEGDEAVPGGHGTGGQNDTGGNGTGGPGTPDIVRNAFTMTLSLIFRERDTYYDWGEPLLLRGGSELKIRVQLRPGSPVPGTHLSLEQSLGAPADSDRDPTFRLFDAIGPISARGSENEQQGGKEVIHRFRDMPSQQQRLAYTNESGGEQGYFTWTRTVRMSASGGNSTEGIRTSYRTDGVSLVLYSSLQARADATLYDFDPTVGIIPEAFPPVIQELVDRLLAHRQSSLLGVIIGLAAGMAIMAARGATVRRRDRVDLVRLEKNPYYRAK